MALLRVPGPLGLNGLSGLTANRFAVDTKLANFTSEFLTAAAKAQSKWFPNKDDWAPAVHALNRLSMFDMLRVLTKFKPGNFDGLDADKVALMLYSRELLGQEASNRIRFAFLVVDALSIQDFGVPPEQVNDAREFLGCTRLNDEGVRTIIDAAVTQAEAEIGLDSHAASRPCCGKYYYAWIHVLRDERRKPGKSLISNLAAAAHYMLSRYHTCQALASVAQMKFIIRAYDDKKFIAIGSGDREMKTIATTGNRPFPIDFAIRNWANQGADEGNRNRLQCNFTENPPLLIPEVNSQEWGFE